MKNALKVFLTAVLFLIEITTFAQAPIYTMADEMPQFIGGEEKLIEYLGMNIKYPSMARENGITGTVYITFVVEDDGKITDVKKLRGIGNGCDEEAIRVAESMPNWVPGKSNGKVVRVRYNLPIKFQLNSQMNTNEISNKYDMYENISPSEKQCYNYIDKCVKECNQKLVSTNNAYQRSASFTPRGYAAFVKQTFYSPHDVNVFKTTDILWDHLTDINISELTFEYSCICMNFASGFEPKNYWARSGSGGTFLKITLDPFDIDIVEENCKCINYYKMGKRQGFSIVVKKENAQKCVEMLKELSAIAKSNNNSSVSSSLYEHESWVGNELIKIHTDSRGIKQGSYEVRDRSGKITTMGEYKDNEKVGQWIERGITFSYGGIGKNCSCQGYSR